MFDALGRGGSKKKFVSGDRLLPIGEKRPAKLRRARAIAETPSVNSLGPRMIRLRYVLGNAGSLRQSKMELHAANLDRRKTSSMILARRQRSLRARDRASRNYYKSHSTCGRSAFFKRYPARIPVTPPPTIRTSTDRRRARGPNFGRLEESNQ